MAILPNSLDYTDKDFDSIRTRLISLIRSAFPDWTDFQVATFSNLLLESFSFVGDIVMFYQDNQGKESRLQNTQLRKNAIALAKQIGFTPDGAVAATVDQLFTLSAIPTNDVIIPAGTIVKTSDVTDAVRCQLLLPLTILALADPPQGIATVENSENQQDVFAANGLPNQEVILNATPFLDDSDVVTAGNGAYTKVDNFLSSGPTDRHYTIVVDENDRATTRFGNSINGELPSGTITYDYKTGGGAIGNVDANTLNIIEGTFTDVLSNPVTITVNNPLAASGGADRQTVEQIKLFAPEELRVLNRTVSREDYEIGARGAGAARALLLTSDQAGGIPENQGFLYVVPVGGGLPSASLKADILAAVTVTKPSTVTFKVSVSDPIYKTVDIAATVFLDQGATEAGVRAAVDTDFAEYFQITNADGTPNTNIDFGFNKKKNDGTPAPEIPLTDLMCLMKDATGIRKVGDLNSDFTIDGMHEDLTLLLFEFPILGQISLTNGETGDSF